MIKIARMQSGEDVIADVKEIRANPEATQALGYEFADAFTAMIQRPTENMFLTEETDQNSLDQLKDMQLEFFPWAPLASGRNIVSLFSVVSMSEPHENVLKGYQQVLEQYKNLQKPKDNAEIDYSQTPPDDLLIGQTDGDG
jgi:hypothetical protein